MSDAEKALQDYVARINAAPGPAANIHRPADPTPDQLLEWVTEEVRDYGFCCGHDCVTEGAESVAQRIIDTVKRVTG